MSPDHEDLTATMLADDPNDISRVDDWIDYGKRQSDDPRRQRFVAEFNMNMDIYSLNSLIPMMRTS